MPERNPQRLFSLCFVLAVLAFSLSAAAQSEGSIAKLQRFELYSNLHVNQHHFLHALARNQASPEEYLRAHAEPALDESSMASMLSAIDYYREHLAKRNLLFDGYLNNVKLHLMKHASDAELTAGRMQTGQFEALRSTRQVYEQHFWPTHDAANRKLVAETLPLLRAIELPTLARIEQLADARFPEHWSVHLSWFANEQGAYTSIFPETVAVIASQDGHTQSGRDDFVEIVFHEPAHAVIQHDRGAIAETIAAAGSKLGIKPPPHLWHAIHFYFVGMAVQEQMAAQGRGNYDLYMRRNDVFKSMHESVFRGLPDYVEGKASLQQAVEKALAAPQQPRD